MASRVAKANIFHFGIFVLSLLRLGVSSKDWTPPYNAETAQRLEDSGTILLGKTNLDEFGMGSHNVHSVHGAVRNPRNVNHVAGGSSGGSAAAVAAGMVFG
jgi:aspartyl-tRNA(Asn)/glutamyl-tRNA(Gln) amidotransferase subunit A